MAVLKQGRDVLGATQVMDLYPSIHAVTREYGEPDGRPVTRDGGETFALRCAHCGYPIKDSRKVKNCPICGSDNLTGARL